VENNIDVIRQVLKSFGYRHTSSLNVFEKPIGFTRICVKIENHIDYGLTLIGEIVAFRNGEGTLCNRVIYHLYITDDDQIDMNTKLNMENTSRYVAEFETDLICPNDSGFKLSYIEKDFTPLNFITQREILEMLDL
jgi:hypothetical protein